MGKKIRKDSKEINLKKDLDALSKILGDDFSNVFSDDCNHPLWYLLESTGFEYNCKCLICGFEKEDYPRNFENVISGERMYNYAARSEKSFMEMQEKFSSLLMKYYYLCKKRKDFCCDNQRDDELNSFNPKYVYEHFGRSK